ncbi:MAG TPA: DegV family protein [Dehalococcoidales bacterium]|nr:DegV family protein [Dehalococcoidales bacterium]
MPVRVVTDSSSDLSPQVAQELGITVVPLYLHFGDKVYRDGVDINHDEFYQKLVDSPVHPTTSQPPPLDFAEVYNGLAKETDEVVSLHLSSKTSGTYSSALRGKEMIREGCRIEVVDTLSVSMGLGLIAMAAARLAKAGESLQGVMDEISQAIYATRIIGLFDTLRYLLLGGRIGKAKALLGTLLNVKPLLTMRDGEILPLGMARTRARGVERLIDFVKSALHVQELAIIHSTTPDEASSLKERIAAFLAEDRIHIARLGPALGVHGGPGTLLLALREKASGVMQEAREGEHLKKKFSLPSLSIPKLKFSCPGL